MPEKNDTLVGCLGKYENKWCIVIPLETQSKSKQALVYPLESLELWIFDVSQAILDEYVFYRVYIEAVQYNEKIAIRFADYAYDRPPVTMRLIDKTNKET
jgi:hypothetical protein